MGAPHLPGELGAGAVKTAVHIQNRTPNDVLGENMPLEEWGKTCYYGTVPKCQRCGREGHEAEI